MVTVDSIERFERELKELSSFTAGFTTRRYLDSTAQEGGKTGEFYREMADAIGTDLDVEIKVSIPKDGFFPSAGRKLKGTVSDLVAFAVKQNKQMQVSGTTSQANSSNSTSSVIPSWNRRTSSSAKTSQDNSPTS